MIVDGVSCGQLWQNVRNKRINPGLIAAAVASVISMNPAQAGWMHNAAANVIPILVHKAAQRAIQAELNEERRNQMAHLSHSPHMVPRQLRREPANSPFLMTTTSAFSRPLPGYQWNPRSAASYLQNGEQSSDNDDNQNDAQNSTNSLYVPNGTNASGVREYPTEKQYHPAYALPAARRVPASAVSQAFSNGAAAGYSYEQLVAANIFESDPVHGSVFKRKGPVHYIILHSTETASPADARRVILSWNNRGLRHPASQFVVDRDGTICSTVNPDLVTVHIDTRKTLKGYSNDNSIGIEIVRSGTQQYTQPQLESVTRLVSYLQGHYGVADSDVTTHHHVQPSDRSDPVGFDFLAFENSKTELRGLASSSLPSQIYNPRAEHHFMNMPKSAPDFKHGND